LPEERLVFTTPPAPLALTYLYYFVSLFALLALAAGVDRVTPSLAVGAVLALAGVILVQIRREPAVEGPKS